MIKSFGNKETQKIYNQQLSRKLPQDIQQRALDKLIVIHTAISIDDLTTPPSNYLKQLKGNLEGYWSIRVNKQWRIIFRWENNHAYDVEIVDYH